MNDFNYSVFDNAVLSVKDGDYEKDGILYCGKCHTAKQKKINKYGINRTVPMMCTCEHLAYLQKQEEDRQQQEFLEISRLRSSGINDLKMHKWTFENDNGQNPHMARAEKYVAHWQEMKHEGIGLLLWGDVGTGKTFMAACIANALISQGVPVMMTNFAKILNTMQQFGFDKNEYIADMNRHSLLIIDDLGIERGTEFALEIVYNVIDSRYKTGKPLIVTTNLTMQQLAEPQDMAHKRIYDRVLEMCVPLEFRGKNMREELAMRKMDKARQLLA